MMTTSATARTLALMLLAAAAGCAPSGSNGQIASSPYSTPSASNRNSLAAQELTQRAAKLLENDPPKFAEAEKLLCEALTHDIQFGPAHNDLGVVHLQQGKVYEAAQEFEWARKLMPGHPDPRMNLAITLESVGRVDEALAAYDSALEVYPNHLPTIQALARLQMRRDRTDERTDGFLREIALRGENETWRDWAQMHLALTDGQDEAFVVPSQSRKSGPKP